MHLASSIGPTVVADDSSLIFQTHKYNLKELTWIHWRAEQDTRSSTVFQHLTPERRTAYKGAPGSTCVTDPPRVEPPLLPSYLSRIRGGAGPSHTPTWGQSALGGGSMMTDAKPGPASRGVTQASRSQTGSYRRPIVTCGKWAGYMRGGGTFVCYQTIMYA